MWQRASPWYFTTGEREGAAGSDEVRPTASTACWAALVAVAVRVCSPASRFGWRRAASGRQTFDPWNRSSVGLDRLHDDKG